ncbi:MAG: translation initiation factor IF-2 [Thermoplasmata archaeon]|nr:translation initiation factor IF-2 [Thermoplasmata archaeon]
MYIRQPIVAVLGHVDHGKTTLLDYIRGSAIAAREAGAITQHIGATEVPLDAIEKICGNLLKGKKFKIPGLLFIDTPGHFAFMTLRARGGALADIAVLVVDINEGILDQTEESIKILKKYKTPFVVAANKIDAIPGWRKVDGIISKRIEQQNDMAKKEFEERLYKLIGGLYDRGFSSERYDKIRDFTRNIAVVPISAKTGEGIPELLMILIGLAQRYLEKNLESEDKAGEGTILEVKEERGLGTTVDVIVYNGTIKAGDKIVVGGRDGAFITQVRALLKPKPLDEIRDPTDKFQNVKECIAACGIKIVAPELERAFAGAPIKVLENEEEDIRKIEKEMRADIKTDDEGIIVKADALGSLEALSFLLRDKGIKIRKAEVGDISKRDIMEATTNADRLNKVILGFNVRVLEEEHEDVEIIVDRIIYKLLEKFEEWRENKKKEIEEERRKEITYPGMILLLPDYVFRVSKPAIVGVRVVAGEIRTGQKLIRDDGKQVGRIKSIQSDKRSVQVAKQGMEVAVAIEGATVGRQIKPGQTLFVDISQEEARKLQEMELSPDEADVLDKLIKIKRKENKLWGA